MVTQAASLVDSVLSRWEAGAPADARAALAQYPILAARKSCVFRLAYEEWCRTYEAGERPDIDGYCRTYSVCASTLRIRLEIDGLLRSNPELVQKKINWPRSGDYFGKLELDGELGRGAMGRVFLARDHALAGRMLVLKLAMDAAIEAETLSRVSHPGIVPIHFAHHDEKSKLTGICMPLLSFTTLQDVLDWRLQCDDNYPQILRRMDAEYDSPEQLAAVRDASPIADPPHDFVQATVWLGARLAAALDHVHQRGVLHLDLKPSNILVTPSGGPMLIDFNLSRHSSGRPSLFFGGTPKYMSPEQLDQFAASDEGRHAIDEKSDVYALGAILYEVLTKRHPLDPLPPEMTMEAAARSIRARQAAPIASPAEHCPQADGELCELILRCLSERPEDRPTAAQLAAALEGQLTLLGRARRWESMNRRTLLAGGIFAALGVGLYAWQQSTIEWTQRGWEQYHAGDLSSAAASFSTAIERNPQNAEAFFGRGRARMGKDPDAAYLDLANATKLNDDPRAWACLGYLEKRKDVAREYFERASQNLDTPELTCCLGYALYNTRDPDRARAKRCFESLLLSGTEYPLALRNLVHMEVRGRALKLSELRSLISEDTVRIANRARHANPDSPDLVADAAVVLASRMSGEARQAFVVQELLKAAQLGLDASTFTKYARMFAVHEHPAIQKIGILKDRSQGTLPYEDPLRSIDAQLGK